VDEPPILDKPIGTTQNGVRYLLSRNEGAQFGWPCTTKKNDNPTCSPLSLSLSLVFCFFIFLFCARRDARPDQASERAQVLRTVRPSVRPSSLLSLSLFINLPKAGGPVDEAMFRMREKCRSEQGGTFFACEFLLVSSSSSSSSSSSPPPFSSSYSSYSSSGRRSGDSEVFADSFVFLMLQVSKYWLSSLYRLLLLRCSSRLLSVYLIVIIIVCSVFGVLFFLFPCFCLRHEMKFHACLFFFFFLLRLLLLLSRGCKKGLSDRYDSMLREV
jgi:hypothetical protein